MSYDLTIIGAGPGGYVAAIKAAKLGAKALLIEKQALGGTCLNKGCIPTKALLASAQKLDLFKKTKEFGVECESVPKFNIKQAQTRKQKIVSDLQKGIEKLVKQNKIELITGTAAFLSNNKISVDRREIDTKNILIATGSVWSEIKGIIPDAKNIVTSDEALDWKDVPESVLIIGGGVIGCEFASILNSFGSKITIVEALPSILSSVEGMLSRLLAKSFKQNGVDIFTDTIVKTAKITNSSVETEFSNNTQMNFNNAIVCIGRKPNTKNLGLENTDIILRENGAIKVNEFYETNVKNIFAIGDVIGNPMLAHVASAEAISCVEHIFATGSQVNYNAIPSPIFTIPELAGVGKTSEQLKKENKTFKTGRFSYTASGKALCDGDTEGIAIVHTDENETIIGAHFFGKNATLLVAEATLAIQKQTKINEIEHIIHAHPTLSEVFAEAMLDANGMAIHKIGKD